MSQAGSHWGYNAHYQSLSLSRRARNWCTGKTNPSWQPVRPSGQWQWISVPLARSLSKFSVRVFHFCSVLCTILNSPLPEEGRIKKARVPSMLAFLWHGIKCSGVRASLLLANNKLKRWGQKSQSSALPFQHRVNICSSLHLCLWSL